MSSVVPAGGPGLILNAVADELARADGGASVPPAGDNLKLGTDLNELPTLIGPLRGDLSLADLSLDLLMQLLGAEERETSVKTSTASLKAMAGERKAANDKALDEIKKRIDLLAEQKKLSVFAKIFKYIGMAVGAIAAAATIAIGAMTGNVLMVAAGALMAIMVVDSIVSEATDGKYSLSAGVAALAKECHASEETAQWIAFAASMVLVAATVVLSFGAAGAGSAASMAGKIGTILGKVQQATALINGVAAIGSGAVQIRAAVLNYETANSQVRTKKLQAILERLREAFETEEDFLKFIVEKFAKIVSAVADIIKKHFEAQHQMLAGGAPPMV
jgi:hypothetical protein